MKSSRVESSAGAVQAVDLISSVRGLHMLGSSELGRLLKEANGSVLRYSNEDGPSVQVDVEKLATCLPLHLIAVFMSVERDESLFRYMLSGVRLLHALCDLANWHAKLEQILLDDVRVSEQLLDLVFYLLIVLGGYKQEKSDPSPLPLLHSALVANSLLLIPRFISARVPDLVHVLLSHPKIEIFMDVAFRAVCMTIRSLGIKLSARHADFCRKSNLTAEQTAVYLCQQSEASLQLLHSLGQQKTFRERVLKNKELCGKGGVLALGQTILKLDIAPSLQGSAIIVAAVSRLKARMLSILLQLCEAESISYLDEVASCPESLALAKSVILEVLKVLRAVFGRDSRNVAAKAEKSYPTGLLHLNAMRLTDIFSDDSNFRSYIMTYFTEVLSDIFSLSHGDFLSFWCSSDLPSREEDASLDYDSFAAAGWILDAFSSSGSVNESTIEYGLIPDILPQTLYAHQRTALFVKIIANLHCFVPTICEEQERNLFLQKFLQCLHIDSCKLEPETADTSESQRAITVYKNLRYLLSHAESLIPTFLNEEDVQLLRVFFKQVQALMPPGIAEENGVQVSSLNTQENASRGARGHEGEVEKVKIGGPGTSSLKGKASADPTEKHDLKMARDTKEGGPEQVQEEEMTETLQSMDKQPRKRKRTIMNDNQIRLMEDALVDEPDMQRNAASIQLWADKLSHYGSEVTTAQLKNWLNNRKARLARAAKDGRPQTHQIEVDKSVPEKHPKRLGSKRESPESPNMESHTPSSSKASAQGTTRNSPAENTEATAPAEPEAATFKLGQTVVLIGEGGEEVGRGRLFQLHGVWSGKDLDESKLCVVRVEELKADRSSRIPYPIFSGHTFEEVETNWGMMSVMWDVDKISLPMS
ncbi:hypothetical protein MLD38_011193 [Melastoma candidum]|uniref:Uncharacterized protein n=1 Tax=Melastoma candidum TaxID=119954 RepID=A0ACB9R6F2_9MYRT|nr:hypothetical protein MLD38_011193 [Melastoma candidum]